MKNLYFDKWQINKIIEDYEINPELAKNETIAYLENFPKDYYMYSFYAGILITLGEFELATLTLDKLELMIKKDNDYNKDDAKYDKLQANIIFQKLRVLLYCDKYQEFINLSIYGKHNFDVNKEIFYCKKALGYIDPNIRFNDAYIIRQIVRYKNDDFLEHIKKHQAIYNENENPNKCLFNSDFPLDKVIAETKKYIPSDSRLNTGFFDNVYVFKYDNCGKEDKKNTDYFKIITFNNTNNYITMLPILHGEYLPHVDLNYLNEEKEKTNTRRLSQIDKFNKRYNLK